LGNFLETEIKSFQAKSQLKNILVVREVDLRHNTKETIERITEFIGTKLGDESLRHLEDFLSVDKLRKLAEANRDATNSTGHEQVTYLHPGHIAESTSEQQCADETKEYITHLIEANQSTLDESGYCRVI
jgi:predicted transcriptional regulator